MNTTENWRDIPSFEGRYLVSDLGRVRSLRDGRLLRQFTNIDGYLCVGLAGKQIKVHRLVLLAFVGPSSLGTRHGNGIRTDNRLSNLCYGTQKENLADRERHGNTLHGIKNPQAKLTEAQVIEIRTATGRHEDIAKRYGVSQPLVSGIVARRSWRHL